MTLHAIVLHQVLYSMRIPRYYLVQMNKQFRYLAALQYIKEKSTVPLYSTVHILPNLRPLTSVGKIMSKLDFLGTQ
jgi:hypothetical protein